MMKTAEKRRVAIYLLLFVLRIIRVHSAVVKTPKNSAVSVDDRSYFNCSSDGTSIGWTKSSNGNIGSPNATTLTDFNCNVISNFTRNFRTEKPNVNECNLIISNVSLSLGGYYTCQSGIGANSYFHGILVVLDANSNLMSNRTEDIASGDDFAIGMTITYGGPMQNLPSTIPPLFPSFKWTIESDPSVSVTSFDAVTSSTSSSYIAIEANAPIVPSYICTLYFKPPINPPPQCDTSAPKFETSWKTQKIDVIFLFDDITITNRSSSPCVNDTMILSCKAEGYPPPRYSWRNVDTNVTIANDSGVTVNTGGHYECIVSNKARTVTQKYNAKKCISPNGTAIRHKGSAIDTILDCNGCKGVDILCTSFALPEAMYEWIYPDESLRQGSTVTVNMNGNVTCKAYNRIKGIQYYDSYTITITGIVLDTQSSSDEEILLIVLVILGSWIFINLFVSGISFIFYKRNQMIINQKLPFLKQMLSCANAKDNKEKDGLCRKFFWILLCVAISCFVAVIVYPILFGISGRPCCHKSSQECVDSSSSNSRKPKENDQSMQTQYQELQTHSETTRVYEELSQGLEVNSVIVDDDTSEFGYANRSTGYSAYSNTASNQPTPLPYEELRRIPQTADAYQELSFDAEYRNMRTNDG